MRNQENEIITELLSYPITNEELNIIGSLKANLIRIEAELTEINTQLTRCLIQKRASPEVIKLKKINNINYEISDLKKELSKKNKNKNDIRRIKDEIISYEEQLYNLGSPPINPMVRDLDSNSRRIRLIFDDEADP